jgi:hypothetical protein
MDERSKAGEVTRDVQVANAFFTVVAVGFAFLGRTRLSLYSLKELAIFLFAIATLVIAILVIVIALFVSWKGIRLGLLKLEAVGKSRLRTYECDPSLPGMPSPAHSEVFNVVP